MRVGSSFLLDPTCIPSPKSHLQKVSSCKHPCHSWDLRLETPCELVNPNFHPPNGWDCMDWPHVTWDLRPMWTAPKNIWKVGPSIKKNHWVWGSSNIHLHRRELHIHLLHLTCTNHVLILSPSSLHYKIWCIPGCGEVRSNRTCLGVHGNCCCSEWVREGVIYRSLWSSTCVSSTWYHFIHFSW